jgi:hypothetical protein
MVFHIWNHCMDFYEVWHWGDLHWVIRQI